MDNIKRRLVEAVSKILRSEAVVRERGRLIRESVQRRSGKDWRLKGKSAEELDVIAMLENLRDTRTVEDISDQNWQHSRAQTFALYLIAFQLEKLLKTIRNDGHEGDNHALTTSVPSGGSVDVGDVGEVSPPPAETTAPEGTDPAFVCRKDDCAGNCGRPYWDGPTLLDVTQRWRRIGQHEVSFANWAGRTGRREWVDDDVNR